MPRLILSADPHFLRYNAKRRAVYGAFFFLAFIILFGALDSAKAGFVERLSGVDALKRFESAQDTAQKIRPGGRTPLMAASLGGDVKAVKALLVKRSRVNAKDGAGNTALILACFSGHENVAQILIKSGADVNICPAEHGLSPLLIASAKGLDKTVQSLLAKKADLNARGQRGQSALYMACFTGHAIVVSLLLEAGADPNIADDKNQTPLYFAAYGGFVDIVSMLLKKGADIHARTKPLNQDALMAASIAGEYEIARMLIEKGGRFHIKDSQGMTAMMFAAQHGHTDIVNFMLGHYAHPLLSPFVRGEPENKAGSSQD